MTCSQSNNKNCTFYQFNKKYTHKVNEQSSRFSKKFKNSGITDVEHDTCYTSVE